MLLASCDVLASTDVDGLVAVGPNPGTLLSLLIGCLFPITFFSFSSQCLMYVTRSLGT